MPNRGGARAEPSHAPLRSAMPRVEFETSTVAASSALVRCCPTKPLLRLSRRQRTLTPADHARRRHSNCCDGDRFGEIALRLHCAWPILRMRLFTSPMKITCIVRQQHRIRSGQFRTGSTSADNSWTVACCRAEPRSRLFRHCARSGACAQAAFAYSALRYQLGNGNFFSEG